MASFSDSPWEIVEEIINALQHDIGALKACSQTCTSLLPLCRKQLFHSIELNVRPSNIPRPPRAIVLFGHLLDGNPEIANYVRKLYYQTDLQDHEDDDVPRILGKLHQVQFFRLYGMDQDWSTLRRPFQKSLLNIIHSPSVTSLEISCFRNFPIDAFIPCINLIDLALTLLRGNGTYEPKNFVSEAIIRLRSFTFDGHAALRLFEAKRSDSLPVLNFSNLQTLNVVVMRHSDLVAMHALLNAVEKLETLNYAVENLNDGFASLGSFMNLSSLSSLKTLGFELNINDDTQDPLGGLCDELMALQMMNAIEEINLQVYVEIDCQCKTGDEWGRLDTALAKGFDKLHRVTLSIVIYVLSYWTAGYELEKRLKRLPEEQFPVLSSNGTVVFDFSAAVDFC